MELTAETIAQIVRTEVTAALNPNLDRVRAAAYIGMSVDYIDLKKRTGELKPHFIGSKPFYSRTDLDGLFRRKKN